MSEAALLAAVLAAPEDDAPRLVYADHLQANGDPRGELIAVQCELARIAPSEDTEARKGNVIRRRRTDRAETLREREKELLRANRDAWIRPFAPSIDSNVDFERGFIERAFAFRTERLFENDLPLFAREPVRELSTSADEDATAARFAARPELSRLETLDLARHYSPPDGERSAVGDAIAGGPTRPKLRRLALRRFALGDAGWKTIAEAARFPALEALDLHYLQMTPETAVPIFRDERFARLTEVGLSVVSLLPEHVEEIVRAPLAKRLVSLTLHSCSLDEASVRALAQGAFPALERLDLSNNAGVSAAVGGLFASPGLQGLRELRIGMSRVDFDDPALYRRDLLPALEILDLRGGWPQANRRQAKNLRGRWERRVLFDEDSR